MPARRAVEDASVRALEPAARQIGGPDGRGVPAHLEPPCEVPDNSERVVRPLLEPLALGGEPGLGHQKRGGEAVAPRLGPPPVRVGARRPVLVADAAHAEKDVAVLVQQRKGPGLAGVLRVDQYCARVGVGHGQPACPRRVQRVLEHEYVQPLDRLAEHAVDAARRARDGPVRAPRHRKPGPLRARRLLGRHAGGDPRGNVRAGGNAPVVHHLPRDRLHVAHAPDRGPVGGVQLFRGAAHHPVVGRMLGFRRDRGEDQVLGHLYAPGEGPHLRVLDFARAGPFVDPPPVDPHLPRYGVVVHAVVFDDRLYDKRLELQIDAGRLVGHGDGAHRGAIFQAECSTGRRLGGERGHPEPEDPLQRRLRFPRKTTLPRPPACRPDGVGARRGI